MVGSEGGGEFGQALPELAATEGGGVPRVTLGDSGGLHVSPGESFWWRVGRALAGLGMIF